MSRVLVEAYSCAPDAGSEKGVGWQIIRRLARHGDYDLIVVTRAKNKMAILEAGDAWVEKVRWVFVEPRESWLALKAWGGIGLRAYHWAWGRAAVEVIRRDFEIGSFDLVHRLTFGSMFPPSQFAKLGLPMVVGPAGGAEMTPREFQVGLTGGGWLRDLFREKVFGFGISLPWTRRAYAECRVGLGATNDSVKALRGLGCGKVWRVAQSGCGGDEVTKYVSENSSSDEAPVGVVRLVCASRFISWKAVDVAIDAVGEVVARGVNVRLVILGEGPLEAQLKKRVLRLGLERQVSFPGKLPGLEDVFDLIRGADALIHPALNEAFGQVVLESLALGRQVLCLDWQGPGMIVTEDCGVKIPPGSRDVVVRGFADAICDLAGRRAKWGEIQDAAVARAGEFTWERVAGEVARAYEVAAMPCLVSETD